MKSNNRYLGALIMAPFIIFIFLGGIWLKYFTIALSVLGLYEFYKTVKVKKMKPIVFMGYLLLALYYLTDNNFEILSYMIIIATFILLCVPIINLKYNFIDVSITLLGFIYVGVFFSFIYLVNSKYGGQYLVWLIFLSSWFCDTMAYYAGRLFGKHKLCPKVSPKKTIEGSLGGVLGSTLACVIFGIILSKYYPIVSISNYLVIGILCGVFCQLGDLVASSIKRYVGIKDYSNLIPGHGGILDRFDSILFAAVVVYFYLTFIVFI
ncbi:phosphatidate cytidylyltransferase [Clostridium tarantellae]|uniref:Phosphatidate cytidylyltransferase n=1 Tax=Clostridium tarantellae TaxID=39493 RepID=A0A6I1MFV1_9CLOT|nr:phosphatidate cytidylyltransferase [Clostridium tarantellae]MPQ42406.1 CDP-archaeol synthase [Clostridium tarantellae]